MRKKSLRKMLFAFALGAVCVPCAAIGTGALQNAEPVFAAAETTIEYTAPTAKEGLVYNGQEQELVHAGIAPDGYTMVYRLNYDDEKQTTEIPTGKDWGGYIIQYKIVDGENNVVVDYSDYSDDGYIYVSMGKAPLTVRANDITIEQYDWYGFEPTYTVEGFIGDDYFGDYYGAKPSFSYFSNYGVVGEYELTFDEGYGHADNYTITFVPGKITVYEHTNCRDGEDYPTCMGYICYYCEGFYGEPTEDAHTWDESTGLCYHCEMPCSHEEQTVYCKGSYCGICGFNCDEKNTDEDSHKWNQWGSCDYCYVDCEHESYNLTTAECAVCKSVVKNVAVIVGENITLYDDVFEAIANAPENATIKILRDIFLEASYQIDNSITLDLNGKTMAHPSLGRITINVPIVIMDSVGGGALDIGINFNALCVLKGGCYRYFSINVAGKTYSDFLGKGYHYYANQDGVGKDSPLTEEEMPDGYMIWVLFDCTHTYGDWTVTKPATETEKGEETRVCSVCEKAERQEIPILEKPTDTPSGGEQGGSTVEPDNNPTDTPSGGEQGGSTVEPDNNPTDLPSGGGSGSTATPDNNPTETPDNTTEDTTPSDGGEEAEKGCKSALSYLSTLGVLALGAACVKARKRKE